jgi:hypothetical protein
VVQGRACAIGCAAGHLMAIEAHGFAQHAQVGDPALLASLAFSSS